MDNRAKRWKRCIPFVLFAETLIPSAHCAPYTLEQCFELALKRSDSLASQNELVEQADEHLWQARASFSPTVSGTLLWQKQQDPGGGIASSFSPSEQTTVKAGATFNLFRGLRDLNTLRQKGYEKDSAEHAFAQARQQLYLDTAQAYFNVLAYEYDLRNYRREIEANQKRKAELKSLKSLARAREADIVLVDASVAILDGSVAQTQGLLANARQTLAFLTGLPESSELIEDVAPMAKIEPIENWLQKIEQRPDVQQASHSYEAANLSVWSLRGAHLPSADLGANYYFQRPGFVSNVTWDVQIALTVPLFAGGATQSLVREAASLRASREFGLNQARKQAEREIRSAHGVVSADWEQIQKLERAAQLSQSRYELLVRDNRQGLASNVDVLQALASAYQTKRSYDHVRFTAQYDYLKLQTAAQRISP